MRRDDVFPSEPPVLDLDRVRIRPLLETDAPAILAMYSDPETMRYLARPRLARLEEAEELVAKTIASYADGSLLQLAIERKADAAFLGLCLLFRFHKPSLRAELGYTLATEHRSKGYMREALRGFVRHAFATLGLHRLEADIDPRNRASARVLEDLGFQAEGTLRERWLVNGERSDSLMYGLLQREWRSA